MVVSAIVAVYPILARLFQAIVLTLLTKSLPFSIVVDTDSSCSATNLLCLNETAFVYCSSASDLLIVSKTEWFCPAGFVCDSTGNTP